MNTAAGPEWTVRRPPTRSRPVLSLRPNLVDLPQAGRCPGLAREIPGVPAVGLPALPALLVIYD